MLNEELNETTQTAFLEQMILSPVDLPPQFIQLAAYDGSQRFLALWYSATQACLADGRMMRGISYYRVYSPFVNHPAISFFVMGHRADLGSDDTAPTHALVLDTKEHKIYLSEFNLAQNLLETQYPQTKGELEEELKKAAEFIKKFKAASDVEQFHEMGMFEFCGSSLQTDSPRNEQLRFEMQLFLEKEFSEKVFDGKKEENL